MDLGSDNIIVYLIRHGQTQLNKGGERFRGSVDVDLDATGWRQANTLKKLFSNQDFSYVFTSDKKRAMDTADKIMEGREPHPVPVDGLRALDVGDLSGQVKTDQTREIISYHFNNPEIPIPGGESFDQFKARVNPLLVEAIEIGINSPNPVMLVVHSSIIHEAGTLLGGHHEYCLVDPGGVAAIYLKDGKLDAEAIYLPKTTGSSDRPTAIT